MSRLMTTALSIYNAYYNYLFAGHTSVKSSYYETYAMDLCKGLRGWMDNFKGLFIIGEPGTGKTSALSLAAKYYLQWKSEMLEKSLKNFDYTLAIPGMDNNGAFVSPLILVYKKPDMKRSVIDPMSYVSLEFLTHFQLIKKLRDEPDERKWWGCELLLLDDLGRGHDDKSGWNIVLQEEFFDYRWKRRLPTFVTSNIHPKDLRKWVGWERIIDRIADKSWMKAIIVRSEKSKRGKL